SACLKRNSLRASDRLSSLVLSSESIRLWLWMPLSLRGCQLAAARPIPRPAIWQSATCDEVACRLRCYTLSGLGIFRLAPPSEDCAWRDDTSNALREGALAWR